MANAKLVIDIQANADQAQAALDGTSKSAGRMSDGINKAAGIAAAGLVAVAGAAMDCAKAASDQQQAFGGLDAVFGSNADQMKAWAKGAADSMGLSATAYAEGATKIGAQLKNLGVPFDEVSGKTNDLMKLAADLAATYGGSTTDAVNALGAAMRGEADPAEAYGLALSTTAVNARMAADGTDKLTGKAGKQAKAAAILALATEQAAGATGQFARESDSAAGASEIAAANFENAKSALGESLLPVLTEVTKAMTGFAQFVQENSVLVGVLAGILGFLALAIMGVAAAQWAMNAAILANPMTWIVIGIVAAVVALIAVIVAIVKNWDAVVAAFMSGVDAVKGAFSSAWDSIKATVTGVLNQIRSVFAAVWNWLKAQAKAVTNAIKAAFNAVAAPIKSIANKIQAAFTSAFNLLKSAARTVSNSIKSAFNAVAGPIVAIANRIKSAFVGAFNSLKSAASGLGNALSAPFNAIKNAINSVIGAVQSLIGWISRIKIPNISIPGFSSSTASAGAAVTSAGEPRMPGRATRTTTTAPAGVVINITGALDPEAVARQIRTVLGGAQVRRRGVILGART